MLAIESSCDETAAAVVTDERRVLSNVVATQIPVHARYGGVVPELASRSHLTAIRPVVEQALSDAGCTLDEVDAIAVTTGPGLAGCLLVGLQMAKSIAWTRGLPLVPVNHIAAHVDAIFLSDERGAGAVVPELPYVALAVSGGHTSLARVDAPGVLVPLGQTLDDAAGEAFDKVAKMMGLPYPGGVHIDRLGREGDPAAIALPRPMLGKGLDFSFSGLKTAVRYWLEGARDDGASQADLAASAQEAIVDVLVAKSLEACRQQGLRDLVVAGGVACNSRLRDRMLGAAAEAGLRAHLTPARYCTDNAAMIGGLGAMLLARGEALQGMALRRADIHVTQRPTRRVRRGA
ncbi:MAG: tRNA (adenosine(37)-N6)-threonylcarbamoyltransferase complex transferase subunit TsaD [Deltaproteobacteria bacterium]|nr:tRNA (adenosine(37)-N6)-threonylcarbamoyltransferase complex transferase subunit TsaD [Deltaproteobacteria bacterium]